MEKNKIKEFVRKHQFAVGYVVGAGVAVVSAVIGNKIRNGKHVPLKIDTDGLTMGDLGKLGEKLVANIDELTTDTKIEYWRVWWKDPNKK